jgi:hypothetical protein
MIDKLNFKEMLIMNNDKCIELVIGDIATVEAEIEVLVEKLNTTRSSAWQQRYTREIEAKQTVVAHRMRMLELLYQQEGA